MIHFSEEAKRVEPPALLRFETNDLIVTGNSYAIGQLESDTKAFNDRPNLWIVPSNHFFRGWSYTRFNGDSLQTLRLTAKRDTVAYIMKDTNTKHVPGWRSFGVARIHISDLENSIFFKRRAIKKGETVIMPQVALGEMLIFSGSHNEPSSADKKWIATLKNPKRWKLTSDLDTPDLESKVDWNFISFVHFDQVTVGSHKDVVERFRWKLTDNVLKIGSADHQDYWLVTQKNKTTISISKFDRDDVLIWRAVGRPAEEEPTKK